MRKRSMVVTALVGGIVLQAVMVACSSTEIVTSMQDMLGIADLSGVNDAKAAPADPLYRYQGWAATEMMSSGGDAAPVDVPNATNAGGKTTVELNAVKAAKQLIGGVTFTPPRAGKYQVTVSFTAFFSAASSAANSYFRISDGTNIGSSELMIAGVPAAAGTGVYAIPMTLSWIFDLAPGDVTLRLQRQKNTPEQLALCSSGAMIWQIVEL